MLNDLEARLRHGQREHEQLVAQRMQLDQR
jgi:dihydroneopterin aldolase